SPSGHESGSANDGKPVSHMTQHGPVQGTISYMSPEQLDKEDSIDDRSDVYSLGAVLYEILCGQTVFDGERMDILAEKVRSEPPVAPSTKTSAKLPKMLEDLTMQCLQKDLDRRVGSMNDVLRVLSENWLMS
ncbi:MAG: protein kinase, partial [Pseudomonadota bacterium]|nr:protein kinase [Pseudomonadota bacterium]